MKISITIIAFLLLSTCVRGQAQPSEVRISTHGVSGTIISTGHGETWVLTCCHGHLKGNLHRPMKFDIQTSVPVPKGSELKVGSQVVAHNEALDLVLIRINSGPFEFVTPVAPAEMTLTALSTGFDGGKLPGVTRQATVVKEGPTRTTTREAPIPGRSGGALMENNKLFGVCHAYTGGYAKGIYISHAAVLRFLHESGHDDLVNNPGQPGLPQGVLQPSPAPRQNGNINQPREQPGSPQGKPSPRVPGVIGGKPCPT